MSQPGVAQKQRNLIYIHNLPHRYISIAQIRRLKRKKPQVGIIMTQNRLLPGVAQKQRSFSEAGNVP